MKQERFAKLCLVLFVVFFVISLIPLNVQAVTVTESVTLLSTTYDGYEVGVGYGATNETAFQTAWNAVSATLLYSSLTSIVGGHQPGNLSYAIYRTYLFFDSSIIPAGAVIDNATLGLYIATLEGDTNYNITLQTGTTSIYPHTPLEYSDYWKDRYTGNGGSGNVSTITPSAFWNISLSSTGLGWIQNDGITKFCMRSSTDIDGNMSSTSDLTTFYSREYGEAYAPRLYVTYTVGGVSPTPTPVVSPTPTPIPGMPTPTPTLAPIGVTSYIIHAPYYEDGTVANETVTVTVHKNSASSESHVFNGTDGIIDDWTLTLSQPALYMTWNFSTSYNYTRVLYFQSRSNFEEFWLHIPDSSTDITQQYSINTILLAELTNSYTAIMQNVNGYNRVIERYPSDAINALPFSLCMNHQYTLRISSDQGTWDFPIMADTLLTKTYTITADMVSTINLVREFIITATRINGTAMSFYYNDPAEETTSVTSTVKHMTNMEWVTDYTQTDSGNTQSYTLNNLTSTTNYVVFVSAIRNTDTRTWQIGVPKPNSDIQTSGLFDTLGDLPIPAYQLPAIFICLLFFGVGNAKDSDAICVIAIIVCAILQVIGWGYFPAPGIALAGMVAILAYVHKAKMESTILEG